MAKETEDGASVTLDADVSPWEAKLETARAAVNGWADRVSARFAAVSEAVKAKTDAITGYVGKIRADAEDSGDLAKSVGSVVGASLGSLIAPGIGTKIGAYLGGEIGPAMAGAVDFDGILAGIESLAPEVKTQAAEMADAWEGAKFAAQRTWDEVKDIVKGLDLSTLLDGPLEDVAKRFEGLGDQIGEKLAELGGQWAVRLGDLIDTAVERFKAPVAAVADFVQKVATDLGIVDESTQKWGNSIRNLKDVGKDAMLAVAKGVGYVTDALRVAGGVIGTAFVAPFIKGLAAIGREMANFAALGKELPAEFGGGDGGVFDAILKGADRATARLDAIAKKTDKLGMDALMKGLQWEQGDINRRLLEENWGRLQEKNRDDDDARKKKPEIAPDVAPEDIAEAVAAPMRRATTTIQGSREAAAAILADADRMNGAAANNPANRAAVAAEKQVGLQEKQVGLLNKINEQLRNPPEIEAI